MSDIFWCLTFTNKEIEVIYFSIELNAPFFLVIAAFVL